MAINQARLDENRKVRAALKAAGFSKVKVGHGRGTAYGWIHATVIGKWTHREWHDRLRGVAYSAIKIASGRQDRHDDLMTDYFCENISLDYKQEPGYETFTCYRCRTELPISERKTVIYDNLCPRCAAEDERARGA